MTIKTISTSSVFSPALSRKALLAAISLLTLALFFAELTVGSVAIPLAAVWEAVLTGTTEVNAAWANIILEFRLPRALNALFSGAALGVAGLMLQTLFRNPLADPYVLGIVHGARLACALLVTLTGVVGNAFLLRYGLIGDIGLAVASILGSCAILGLLALLSRRVGVVTLLIMGLMIGYFSVGLISMLMHFIDENQAQAFKIWNDASFAGATDQQLQILIPCVIVGLIASIALIKPLNSLLLGENYAASMGVAVGRVKAITLMVIGLLCGVVTAFCGPVAFLGLVAAQLARAFMRSADHRILLPAAGLIGATLGLAADWVVHMPWSRHVFHLNAVIGLVGAPIALYMLYRTKALHHSS
ncbi:Vitamin B12 ABC transporter, permease component BtuC [Methylophaga frappieri]|uniref:Vitamin B12 ABC transporter, permease component BtuC n=2 Tax=Methylophaga frappieri (strain ATCC BAA-2434 / DSM 25690 / JAM7) TaxID=754477 RepID=I1YJE2_METFJ|nr:Vitamin B12 ABC transporter, permease component BtuC [Methylophaga frappieri]